MGSHYRRPAAPANPFADAEGKNPFSDGEPAPTSPAHDGLFASPQATGYRPVAAVSGLPGRGTLILGLGMAALLFSIAAVVCLAGLKEYTIEASLVGVFLTVAAGTLSIAAIVLGQRDLVAHRYGALRPAEKKPARIGFVTGIAAIVVFVIATFIKALIIVIHRLQ